MFNRMTKLLRGAVLAYCVVMASAALGGEWKIEKQESHVTVTVDGEEFTRFVFQDEAAPFPYLHPLRAQDGSSVTRYEPLVDDLAGETKDRSHHRSLWIAHGDVDGVDFWQGKDTRIVTESIQIHGDTLVARLRWESGGDVLLGEERSMRFHSGPGGDRYVDLNVRFRAVGGGRIFGDTRNGTFAMRLAPGLVVDGSEGKVVLKNADDIENGHVWGKVSRWVTVSGQTELNNPVAVTMMAHPENPGGLACWSARTCGLLSANPFGKKDFGHEASGQTHLSEGSDLVYRLRIVIGGDGTKDKIERVWDEFVGQGERG